MLKKINILKNKKNKKSQAYETIQHLIYFIVVSLVIGTIIFILNGSLKSYLDIKDLRFYTFAERILYSKNCFVYEDINSYPGIFDVKKINEESLKNCFSINDKDSTALKSKIGSKLNIYFNNKDTELYFNKEFYESAKPLSFSTKYENYGKRYFILIKDNEKIYPGNILIDVVYLK